MTSTEVLIGPVDGRIYIEYTGRADIRDKVKKDLNKSLKGWEQFVDVA